MSEPITIEVPKVELNGHAFNEEIDIPYTQIFYDPVFNCRGVIAGHTVAPLATDIREHGLYQRIIVHPHEGVPGKPWRVIAGHRRFLACRSLGWEKIPCKVVRGLSELQQRTINLKENVERSQLNILQEANGIAPYKIAHWNRAMIAKELNQPTGWVDIRWRLLELEPEIQQHAAAGILTQQQIKQLYDMPRGEPRYAAVRKIKEAKERGEKAGNIQPIKKKNPLTRKKRGQPEAEWMNNHIMDTLGPCLATRFGAWFKGDISDIDLFRSIRDECKKEGKEYAIPEDSLFIEL